MSKQLELALVSLMPTYGADLPPALVELAGSLLAQSRHKASTLRAEEEIARLYACAHLACDRLKITLDLPPIEPRPPIPPRVYNRLYSHLDNILPNPAASARRTRTPNSKALPQGSSPGSQARALPSRPTPSKENSLAQFRKQSTTGDATPTKSASKKKLAPGESGLYPWIHPVIRHLCDESGSRRLAPSMLAGMEYILTPGGGAVADTWTIKHATALVAAISFFVAMRVKEVKPEDAVDRGTYVPARKEIIEQINKARQEVEIKGNNEENGWDGWANLKTKEFDTAVTKISEHGWLDADWYSGIADVIHMDQRQHAGTLDADDADSTQQVRRADTMFQEKYDYLSEARQADYKVWKEATLSRISQLMEVEGRMDIDTQ